MADQHLIKIQGIGDHWDIGHHDLEGVERWACNFTSDEVMSVLAELVFRGESTRLYTDAEHKKAWQEHGEALEEALAEPVPASEEEG